MILSSPPEQLRDTAPLPGRQPVATSAHWITVVSHLDPRYGGLSSVVPQLSSRLASTCQFKIDLAAFCTKGELYLPTSYPDLSLSEWPASRSQWFRNPSLRETFKNLIQAADGVHIHGLWEQSTAIAAPTARALRKPYILSAHGMLEAWALTNKRLKKKIYAALFERANVRGSACLHALTHAEARDYRRFGATGPIAVIPNGVTVPNSADPALFLAQHPALQGKKILLFLGRIHYKKGLDLLIQAWSRLAANYPEAHLVLAGPDFEGTRASVEKLIQEKQLSSSVLFTGMLRNELKWSALAAAQGFVLPSYSEGLSVSVLEAMGLGLPVIVTEQCNLPEVKELEAGWQIQSEAEQLTSAIREFLSNSAEANSEIGSRGRNLVLTRYNWSTVSERMAELYRWVQGGPKPASVEILTAAGQS
ncbi:MAG: glycosyltransferase [Acidobacteriaceae bacterium]